MVHLGLLTAVIDLILLVLFLLALWHAIKMSELNIQLYFILAGATMMIPVMIYESLLYLDFQNFPINLSIVSWLAKVFFLFGVIGFFIYILHLLTIDDFPTVPVILIAIISGFALGSMITSVQIDATNKTNPIWYEPILGGIFFLLTMNLFSLLSISGFFRVLYQYQKDEFVNSNIISPLDLIGLFLTASTPFFMFLIRIVGLPFDFNTIFLPTAIGFSFHFLSVIINPNQAGYASRPLISSMIIVDTDTQTVLAGYTMIDKPDQNKLQGMAILAVDNLMRQIMDKDLVQMPDYIGNYGDILFIKYRSKVLIGSFRGSGQKMGRFLLRRLLKRFVHDLEDGKDIDFEVLTRRYIFPFTHKKNVGEEHFYHTTLEK